MTDRIHATCLGCKKKLVVPATIAGKRVKCPGCSSVVSIPLVELPSQPPKSEPAATARKPRTAQKESRKPASGQPENKNSPVRPKVDKQLRSKSEASTGTQSNSSAQRKTQNSDRPQKNKKPEPYADNGWLHDDLGEVAAYPSESMPARRRKKKKKKPPKTELFPTGDEQRPTYQSTGVSFESRLCNGKVLGGIGMMAVAIIWFLLGLLAGMIAYKPALLFSWGLGLLVKGLTHSE